MPHLIHNKSSLRQIFCTGIDNQTHNKLASSQKAPTPPGEQFPARDTACVCQLCMRCKVYNRFPRIYSPNIFRQCPLRHCHIIARTPATHHCQLGQWLDVTKQTNQPNNQQTCPITGVTRENMQKNTNDLSIYQINWTQL